MAQAKRNDAQKEGRLLTLISLALALVAFVAPYRWREMPQTLTNGILTMALALGIWAVWDFLPTKWKSPGAKRGAVAAFGGVFFVIVGAWIWWSPNRVATTTGQPAQEGRAFLESGKDIYLKKNTWDFPNGLAGTIARAAGSIWDEGSHYSFGRDSMFPPADGTAEFIPLEELRAEAYKFAMDMSDYERANPSQDRDALDAYYKGHFADRALSLTTEMLRRLGKKDLNVPRDWKYYMLANNGRGVIASKNAVGISPLTSACDYMMFLIYRLGPKGQLKAP